jgi:hypothetical protein
MKNQPTYDDANLILRLYELRREEEMRKARKWMGQSPPFLTREQWLAACPPGTESNAHFRMVTSYWEMAATFVASGVLNAELFYRANNMELLFVWEKIKAIAEPTREVQKNPMYWRNLEDVATGFIRYLNDNSPGAYEQFAANIAKMSAPPAAK